MRLIDADALHAELDAQFAAHDTVTVLVKNLVHKLLDVVPTVRCGECGQWTAHEPPNTSGWGTCRDTHAVIEGRGRLFTPPDFGCAHFGRRAR